jgi:cytoskeletal protein CcmA (bactofilin family)
MFRRKDNDPPRPVPTPVPDKAPEPSFVRPQNEVKMSPAQPELPRRQVDLPTGPGTAPSVANGPAGPAIAVVNKPAAVDVGSKRLIVGQGIRLSGEITACDRLVVEGTVEVTLNETRAVEITETGRFTGGCEVEEAEISGVYEGELTVRNRLLIRSTGRVKGTVRYGEIEVERGGRLSGSVSMLEPPASTN